MKKTIILFVLCLLLCAAAAGCADDTTKYQEMLSRAQESFDHQLSIQQGGFSIPSGFSLPEGSVVIPPMGSFDSIEEVGTPGGDYSVEAMELHLPAEGVLSPDGWYMAKSGKLRLYSHDGEVLWEKDYDAAKGAALSANQAGVAMVCGETLSVYSREGSLLWEETMQKASGSTQPMIAHMTEDGWVYVAVGFKHRDSETLDLHIRRYTPDGSPDTEQIFSGRGNMAVYAMTYHKDYGLAITFSCHWNEGDLTEGKKSNFGIALLGDTLAPIWLSWQEEIYYQNLTLADGSLYVGSHDKTLCLSYADGRVAAQADGKLVSVREKVYLQAKKDVLTVCDKDLKQLSEFPLASGTAERVEETTDGGLLVISSNRTGIIPTPPEVSSIGYAYEWVYTRLDKDGEVVYRVAYDTNQR